MKAEELIKNNSLQYIEVTGEQKVVFEDIAITAVNMAREEEKERVFKVLELTVNKWLYGDDEELFLGNFKEELEENK